jgi:hypothetical protein
MGGADRRGGRGHPDHRPTLITVTNSAGTTGVTYDVDHHRGERLTMDIGARDG